jgi:hypothetical protein
MPIIFLEDVPMQDYRTEIAVKLVLTILFTLAVISCGQVPQTSATDGSQPQFSESDSDDFKGNGSCPYSKSSNASIQSDYKSYDGTGSDEVDVRDLSISADTEVGSLKTLGVVPNSVEFEYHSESHSVTLKNTLSDESIESFKIELNKENDGSLEIFSESTPQNILETCSLKKVMTLELNFSELGDKITQTQTLRASFVENAVGDCGAFFVSEKDRLLRVVAPGDDDDLLYQVYRAGYLNIDQLDDLDEIVIRVSASGDL